MGCNDERRCRIFTGAVPLFSNPARPMKLKTFNCPSCSGPLEYSREAGQVVRCRFCGQSVVVPEPLHGAAEVVREAAGRGVRGVVVAALLVVVGAAAALFLLRRPAPPPAVPAVPPPPVAAPDAPPTGASFQVALSFGEEGIGPGRFEDARHIALDGEGYLYVGEYTGGRIQRFDASGRFVSQWLVDTEQALRGLAADRNGVVYVAQGGQLRRYRGATGAALGAWTAPERLWIDGVYPAPDGGMLAFGGGAAPAQILRFDAQGQVGLAFETQARNARAALDGLGNVYVIGGFNERGKHHEAVFKYDPTGGFVNRFGSAGEEPGQFRAPHAIAVDGRGRVYVSDIQGLQVFDGDGRFLERLDVGHTLFGMVFNDRDELFVVDRNAHRVMKIILRPAS